MVLSATRKISTRILVFVLLIAMLLPTVTVFASTPTSRYAQTNTFEASGSPLLNPNFTTNQWNKWETVAWGVFLSNFVVPMADSYETAFSTSSMDGSRGSGFKALNFSMSGDPAARGILQDFTQFAIDSAMGSQKELFVSYYYVDQAGNIIEPTTPGDPSSVAKVMDKVKDPTKQDITPETTSIANFASLLPRNLGGIANAGEKSNLIKNEVGAWIAGVDYNTTKFDDVIGLNSVEFYPYNWYKEYGMDIDSTSGYAGNPNLMALPPSVAANKNSPNNKLINGTKQVPAGIVDGSSSVESIAVAKLPIIWLEASDKTMVKVWDMLDPWDYQVLIAMLAKEVNSDSAYDSGLGTTRVWETVMTNLDKAMTSGAPLVMDCFGNIVAMIDGKPIVVIPAAYNKHITTTPMVNLVNSLFLTGPTSGVSSEHLLAYGKMPVRAANWWMSNDNETKKDGASKFGPGFPAFGWGGASMPDNAVSLYFDSDSLAYMTFKDRVAKGDSSTKGYYNETIDYQGYKLFPHVAAVIGVLDLDLGGNRKYIRGGGTTDLVVPRLALTGMSKAAGFGKTDTAPFKDKGEGVKSLMVNLTLQESMVGLLPASFNEAETSYVQEIIWQNVTSDVLGSPVVIPVAMQAGNTEGKETWSGLARKFITFYGTQYYPQNKSIELHRLSEAIGETTEGYKTTLDTFARHLMYDKDERPTRALVQHSKTPAVAPYISVTALGDGTKKLSFDRGFGQWLEDTGFIWRDPTYLKKDTVDVSFKNTVVNRGIHYTSMTQRWVKAYPTNRTLSKVASYLGMRGDSEFAAAAAPYVYLSYLNMYGVGTVDGKQGVNVSTINKNPTKFNEKIYDAKSSPIFNYNPADNVNIKSDEDKMRETTDYVWKLLSPTSGHEYKRQLLSSMVGNFIYDQYSTTVYGGALEYRSGGVQQTVTKSQTGFLRFPSLEDNVFTRWFYQDYATVAIGLLSVGLIFIIVLGIFRGRKATWFFISVVLLVTSVIIIPFVNDAASSSMDRLVSKILKDKTTVWSMTEYIANANIVDDFVVAGLTPEEAEIAADITKSMSIAYTDRTLMLKQDISHKVVTLGNFSAYQQFASTRWMLPTIMRQFTADDNSNAYLYVPLVDVADDAANAYWWYNPEDAQNAGLRTTGDAQHKYAVGTQEGVAKAEYTVDTIKKFYPQYHWVDTSLVYDSLGKVKAEPDDPAAKAKLSYRSISQSVTGSVSGVVPIHDYIYIYMNNAYDGDPNSAQAQQVPLLPVKDRPGINPTSGNHTNNLYWGDPELINSGSDSGGAGTYLANLNTYESSLPTAKTVLGHSDPEAPEGTAIPTLNHSKANMALFQLAQKYVRDKPETMYGEFAYLWSTETQYPYFYALVKDTMEAVGRYDYQTGAINNSKADFENPWLAPDKQLSVVLNALTGMPQVSSGTATNVDLNAFFGTTRSNFMYQSGITGADLASVYDKALLPNNAAGSTQPLFTGYVRDILDLESMFHNVIPYMYQMNIITGGLTGDHPEDKGLYGNRIITDGQYKTYKGLPESWLYRTNWATKIVEAPAYNKPERIGYYVNGTKKYDEIRMTYFPDAYRAAKDGGRDMVFSEAQMKMEGLDENDLTTLELKLIQLNKDVAKKWTTLINYINVSGMTAEVMARQMALDATLSFNEIVTPSGLGNTAYALMPSTVDLRSLSFDTIMRVILLNTSKDTNFFGTDAMESVITNFGLLSGVLLLVVTWVCIYGVTIVRAFFLAFLFLIGVIGVARGVFASNASKKATLFGYLANIGILFGLSFLYYEVFNILMTGANSQAYVNSGLQGASATPTIALIIVLIASLLYIWLMYKMFRLALASITSGSFDLGLGAYKDKAQASMNKVSRSFNNLRMGHAYEDMDTRISESRSSGVLLAGTSGTAIQQGSGGGASKRKRRGGATVTPSGTGSGSRALQSGASVKSSRALSALDDHESVDATIERGSRQSTPAAPAVSLDDYLATPSKTENKSNKKK